MKRPELASLLECLNSWPENTVGFNEDKRLIHAVWSLCELRGYGRVLQLAQQIEEIWRDPERLEAFRNMRKERLHLFEPLDDET